MRKKTHTNYLTKQKLKKDNNKTILQNENPYNRFAIVQKGKHNKKTQNTAQHRATTTTTQSMVIEQILHKVAVTLMIPFNTQLFHYLMSSNTNKIVVSNVSSQHSQSIFGYDLTGAGWCETGCIWVEGFNLTARLSSEEAICIHTSPTAASQRESMESLLLFASAVGLSPTAFSFHLYGHSNNRCTGLVEIRLTDPRLQN